MRASGSRDTQKAVENPPLFQPQAVSIQHRRFVIGIDESGVGAFAGPVAAYAVVWEGECAGSLDLVFGEAAKNHRTRSVVRRALFLDKVRTKSRASFGKVVGAPRINEVGLANALEEAIRAVVSDASKHVRTLGAKRSEVLFVFDGEAPWCKGPCDELGSCALQLPHADDLLWEVAAAGMLAKEACDEEMARIHALYPAYGFDAHKGYGTAGHTRALREYGPCAEHRVQLAAVQQASPHTDEVLRAMERAS